MQIKGNEWNGIEGLSRIVLLQALAQIDPVNFGRFNDADASFDMAEQPPYSCILDGVQFVQLQQNMPNTSLSIRDSQDSVQSISKGKIEITIRFHYTRRMADILREEAERERAIKEQKERLRIEAEEEHRRKYAIVDKIRAEMEARDAAPQMSLVDKYAMEAQ